MNVDQSVESSTARGSSPFMRINFLLLFVLIMAWSVHLIAYVIVPGRSMHGMYAPLYSLAYLGVCVLSTLGIARALMRYVRISWENQHEEVTDPVLQSLLIILSGTCVVGVGLHYYDKLLINEWFYNGACLQDIRMQWIAAAAARQGHISSWQSALGHVLSNASLPFVSILILKKQRIKRSHRIFFWFVAVTTLIFYAGLMSARTPVMSLLICATLTYGLQWCTTDKKYIELFKDSWRGLGILIAVFIVYSALIFFDRIHCSQEPTAASSYVGGFYREFDVLETDKEISSDISRIPTMFAIYASNSSWNFEIILAKRPLAIPIFTNSLIGPLIKLNTSLIRGRPLLRLKLLEGASQGDAPRAYSSGLLSMPGAAWYQFGAGGMLIIACIHGALIAVSAMLLGLRGVGGQMGFVVFIMVGTITMYSPLYFAVSNMSFPFMVFAYLVVSFTSVLRRS